MNNLVFVDSGKAVTDSLTIAEVFGKRHDNVLRDIKELGCSSEFALLNFEETPYQHRQNHQHYTKYVITQDGFTLLVMGYTGDDAMRFKEQYISEFNRMRSALEERRLPTVTPSQQLQAILMLDGRQQEFEQRIEKIEKNTTIDYGQQNDLRNVGSRRIIHLLGGKESPAYNDKSLRQKAYSALWNEFKDRFNVNSRNNTRIGDFERAAEYVRNWNLPGKLERSVEDQNRQVQMF